MSQSVGESGDHAHANTNLNSEEKTRTLQRHASPASFLLAFQPAVIAGSRFTLQVAHGAEDEGVARLRLAAVVAGVPVVLGAHVCEDDGVPIADLNVLALAHLQAQLESSGNRWKHRCSIEAQEQE